MGVDEKTPTSSWTLEELSSLAEARLTGLGLLDALPDGRVARAADPRTVRYYQSLGILDRPLSYERTQGAVRTASPAPAPLGQGAPASPLAARGDPGAALREDGSGARDAPRERRGSPPQESGLPMKNVREVVLAPGLKLVADEEWAFGNDPERLVALFRAALAALEKAET